VVDSKSMEGIAGSWLRWQAHQMRPVGEGGWLPPLGRLCLKLPASYHPAQTEADDV
jgi:hypothetical protein